MSRDLLQWRRLKPLASEYIIYPRWDEWNMNETVDAVVCGEHLKLLKTENFLMNLNQQASTYDR